MPRDIDQNQVFYDSNKNPYIRNQGVKIYIGDTPITTTSSGVQTLGAPIQNPTNIPPNMPQQNMGFQLNPAQVPGDISMGGTWGSAPMMPQMNPMNMYGSMMPQMTPFNLFGMDNMSNFNFGNYFGGGFK